MNRDKARDCYCKRAIRENNGIGAARRRPKDAQTRRVRLSQGARACVCVYFLPVSATPTPKSCARRTCFAS
eukprot:2460980-Pleurochrysis_carterae.AAC.1